MDSFFRTDWAWEATRRLWPSDHDDRSRLLTGMMVALAALVLDFDRTPTIIAAQAVTVVGAPLVAGVLLWLASSYDVMGAMSPVFAPM